MANVDRVDDAQFEHMMATLEEVVDKNDERAVEAIAEVVPTYHPWKDKKPETAKAAG